MGAKKLLSTPSSKQSQPPGQKTNNRSRVNDSTKTAKPANTVKSTATKARTNTPVKSLEIEKTVPATTATVTHSTNKKDKDEQPKPHLGKNQSIIQKSSAVGPSKSQPKKTTISQTGVQGTSPKKSPLRQKLTDEKSKAISKVIKSLDIKISGFKAVVGDEQKIECKASISEIVKTKSRAASAKISPGPFGKRDEDDKKVKLAGILGTEPEDAKEEQEETKNVTCSQDIDETSKSVSIPKDLILQKHTLTMAQPETSSSKVIFSNQSKPQQSKTLKKDNKPKNTATGEPKKKYVRKNAKQTLKPDLKKPDENALQSKEEGQKEALTSANAPESLPIKPSGETKVKHSVKRETSICTKKNSKKPDPAIVHPNDLRTPEMNEPALTNSAPEGDSTNDKTLSKAENVSTSNKSVASTAKKTNQSKKPAKPAEKATKPNNKPPAKKVPKKSKESVETAKQLPQTDVAHSEVKKPKNLPKAALKTKAKNEIAVTPAEEATKKPTNQNTHLSSSDLKITTNVSFETSQKLSKTASETIKSPPVTAKPNESPSKSNSSKKLMSVRERLQKKYIGTTFKAFKAKKQITAVKKDSTSPSKSPKREPPRSPSKKSIYSAAKKGDDIYDFKTESESDDNIKMNLIIENSMLSKLSKLAKAKENAKAKEEEKVEEEIKIEQKIVLDDKTKKDDTQVKEEEEILEKEKAKPKLIQNKPKEKPKGEKDYSDEDDRPLQQTKKLLDDAKQSKAGSESVPEDKLSTAKVKAETKSAPKKPVKIVKIAKSKPTKKAPVSKRKSRIESTNSEESENDDSDDTSSSESCLAFGPKRHRMASLNALAKVQCLYENESRTAHELGLSKSSQAPKIRIIASGTSSDEDENAAKKFKKEVPKEESIKEEEEEEDEEEETSAPEEENKRELRNAPGLRGMGKHWDFNDASSFESGHESDVTFKRTEEKTKSKKRKIVKPKPALKTKEKAEPVKPKKASPSKSVKKKPNAPSSKEVSESSEEEENEKKQQKKRKRDGTPEVQVNVTSKRMASLNASALVAATYEVERHLDRNLDSDCSSFESIPDDMKTESSKKSKEQSVKSDPVEETPKENSRPTSTSVVIVQDTDVTITGVYVNSSSGSGQEAYCKMQYRVQSSVTEERVLRPNSIDPPKSYTPLSALSSMRPPGTDGSQSVSSEGFSPTQTQHTFQPTIINRGDQPPPPMVVSQQPPSAHMYPLHPHSQHPPPPHPQAGQEQMHHIHHPQSPPKYHHMHHHHHQQPPLAHPRCESPIRYASGTYQNVQPPMPPPPNSISISGGGSSAFCAPSMQQQQQQQQQSHHDMSGGAVGSWSGSGSGSKNGGYGSGSGWQLGGGSNGWQKGGNGGGWSQGGNGGWQLGGSDSWKQSGNNGWSQGGNGGGWMQNGNGGDWKQGGTNGWSQNGNNGWPQNGNNGWSQNGGWQQNGNGGDWAQESSGWQDDEENNGWQNGNNGAWQGGLGGGSSMSAWKIGGGSSSGWQVGGGSSGPWQSSGKSGKQGGYGNGAAWKQNGGW